MLLLFIIITLSTLYAILIIYFWRSWLSVPLYQPSAGGSTRITVLVPARNEEQHIEKLLYALAAQTYPPAHFEVIVVDDGSTDATPEKIKQFPRVILLPLREDQINSYKKKAIETGIARASGELVVTTDADCIPPPRWLETIASFHEENRSKAIAGPVLIECGNRWIEIFQCMDFMVLQGITAAAVHKGSMSMANGANFSYEKKAFNAVGGFRGIDSIASGDDMLLAHKIAVAFPGQYHYLLSPDATVTTAPLASARAFFRQRSRWAGKSMKYDDKRILPVLVLVYLFNLSFVALLAFGFFDPFYWILLLAALGFKTMIELPFFYSLARFFKQGRTVKYFLFMQPFHILYTVITGIASQLGSFEWKGRKVK